MPALSPKDASRPRHDVQHRGAVGDLHALVAVRAALSGAFAGKFVGEDAAIAVGR